MEQLSLFPAPIPDTEPLVAYRPAEQLEMFSPSLIATARAELLQQLLARDAWQLFKQRLAESVLFGEVGAEVEAMRRGDFAKAHRRCAASGR